MLNPVISEIGFERDEDNVAFYWDNKGPGSIVPIPLTLYYHGRVSYHCPGEMRISVPRQYPMSWSENDIEMRA